jgi:hypothetical protein
MLSRKRKESQSIYYSMTEFAYILLFLAIGISTILFFRYKNLVIELDQVQKEKEALEHDNEKLLKELKDLLKKKDAYPACSKIPDSQIPNTIARVVVDNETTYAIYNYVKSDLSHEKTTIYRSLQNKKYIDKTQIFQKFETDIKNLFKEERQYARKNECYLLVDFENNTNDYSLFKIYKDILNENSIYISNVQ